MYLENVTLKLKLFVDKEKFGNGIKCNLNHYLYFDTLIILRS